MASRLSGPSARSGSGVPNRNKNEEKRPRRSPRNVSAAPACGGHNQGQNAPLNSLNKQYSNSRGVAQTVGNDAENGQDREHVATTRDNVTRAMHGLNLNDDDRPDPNANDNDRSSSNTNHDARSSSNTNQDARPGPNANHSVRSGSNVNDEPNANGAVAQTPRRISNRVILYGNKKYFVKKMFALLFVLEPIRGKMPLQTL